MPFRLRSIVAALLSTAFVVEIPGNVVSAASIAQRSSRVPIVAINAAVPPERIPVKEPHRVRRTIPSTFERPTIVQAVRAVNPVWVKPPQMLRPAEISRISELKQQQQRNSTLPAVTLSVPFRAGRSTPPRPGTSAAQAVQRSVQSTPGGASGTGINPWWRYQEENVPGGGHVMVNVGTGNVLLQDDDMNVAHKGIALAFRRTYNSQSLHNVNGADGAQPGLYGNGWTNAFDAHLTGTSSAINVFDIDGAAYTYTSPNGGASWQPPAGQHATLVSDGGCGFIWTKKSGTIYYFYAPYIQASCAWTQAGQGGYFGRLYEIIGRNRNTYLVFTYAFDSGITSPTGKISAITVTADDLQKATLAFADVNAHRLLQQLTFEDGTTEVSYAYDANGNLVTVSRPPNNASGSRPVQLFGYQTIGSNQVLYYASSPRYYAGCAVSCGSDGETLYFGYFGTSAVSSTLGSIVHFGLANPSISDSVGTGAVQGGYPTSAFGYLVEYYTTGVTTPTFRDTDGHMTNWVVDSAARPSQTQECTTSAGQGTTCTGIWLLTNETWDANNNLVATKDARGYETDFAYDANGNTIAEAAPQTTTSQGTFRPTTLYDYDAFNNVAAYCDQTETHTAGADWTRPPAASDSLCSSHAIAHATFTFTYPSYEPNGELITMTTPPRLQPSYRVLGGTAIRHGLWFAHLGDRRLIRAARRDEQCTDADILLRRRRQP
jgi:YD repeat-containing protein